MKIDVTTKEGREIARIWIKNNESKLPAKLDGGYVYYTDVKRSMIVILDMLDSYEAGTMAFNSALTNWTTINNFLSDRARWNREMSPKMESVSNFNSKLVDKKIVDKKEQKKQVRSRNEMTRHIEIIESAGAYVDDANLSIAIPEGVSLMAVKKSLDYLRKKKFVTQRATFNLDN